MNLETAIQIAKDNPRRTEKLFWENCLLEDRHMAAYTLKKEDHHGYPSLYRLYMEASDLVEYEFAIKYFNSWDHWERVAGAPWFKTFIEAWRKELAIKVKSEAVKAVQAEARGKGKNAYAANKWLIEKNWIETKNNKVGRPNKEEIKDFMSSSEIDDHFTRISN